MFWNNPKTWPRSGNHAKRLVYKIPEVFLWRHLLRLTWILSGFLAISSLKPVSAFLVPKANTLRVKVKLAVRWQVPGWGIFLSCQNRFFLGLPLLLLQERVGLGNICVSFKLWHFLILFQHFRWFFLHIFICCERTLWSNVRLQIPSGHLYLDTPCRLLHLYKQRQYFTFPIIPWALHPFFPEIPQNDPTILLVPVQSFRCPRCPGLSLYISFLSSPSSLSRWLCSGSL